MSASTNMQRQQKALKLAQYVLEQCGDDTELPELVAQTLLTLGQSFRVPKTTSNTTTSTEETKVSKVKGGKRGRSKEKKGTVAIGEKEVRKNKSKSPPSKPPDDFKKSKDDNGVSRSTWSTRLRDAKSRAEAALLTVREEKGINPIQFADYFNKRLTLEEQWKRYVDIFGQGNKANPLEQLPQCALTRDDFLNMGFKVHVDTQHLSLQDVDGKSLKTPTPNQVARVKEAMRLLVVVEPKEESDDS